MRNDRKLSPADKEKLEGKVAEIEKELTTWAREEGILGRGNGCISLHVNIRGERELTSGLEFPESLLETPVREFFSRERLMGGGTSPALATRAQKLIRDGWPNSTMRELLDDCRSKEGLMRCACMGAKTADVLIAAIRKACTVD